MVSLPKVRCRVGPWHPLHELVCTAQPPLECVLISLWQVLLICLGDGLEQLVWGQCSVLHSGLSHHSESCSVPKALGCFRSHVLTGECRADCGGSTGFFYLGCRTWAPIRRDSGKAGHLEFKHRIIVKESALVSTCLVLNDTTQVQKKKLSA